MKNISCFLIPFAIGLITTGAFDALRAAEGPAPATQPQTVVCTFDAPGAIAPSQADPSVLTSIADNPATKNSKCLEVTLKKGGGIHAFDLSTRKYLQSADLARFDAIELEVFNPANTPQRFYLSLQWGWGVYATQRGAAETFEVAPGKWQTVRIDLSSLLNYCEVYPANLRDIYLSPPLGQLSKGDCTFYVRKISLVRLDLPADLDRLSGLLDKLKPIDHFPARIFNSTQLLLNQKQSLLAKIADKSITELDEQKLADEAQKAYRLLLPVYYEKDRWLKHISDDQQALAAVASQVAKPEFGVGLASPLQKIFLDELPFPGTFGTTLSFSLARNECENAQVVVFAETRNLTNVSISASDLVGEGGAVIPAANVRVSPVGYVKLGYHFPYDGFSQHIQWWPDPILTFMDKINVEQGATQPFWVRVRSNKDTKSGKYQGSLTINADGCSPVKIDVNVEVWDFELPDKSSLQTAIYFGWRYAKAVHETHQKAAGSAAIGNEDPQLAADLTARYQQFLLDYKLFPTQLYGKGMPDIAFLKRCKQEGQLGLINIEYIDYSKPTRYYLGRLDKIVPIMKEAGLYSNCILYGFDEFTAEKADKIAAELRPIKQAYPDLKIMATVAFDPFAPNSPLKDLIDIWVPEYNNYPKSADAEKYRKMGKQVWWYTCLSNWAPNNFIYSPPIEIRGLVGAGAIQNRTDGWLYWCANYWGQTKPMETGPLTDWNVTSVGPPGDGCLMYAGPTGPVPSVRLENYRDGIEDYDYYKIVEQRLADGETGKTIPADKLKAARDLLAVHWNPYGDPNVLTAQRTKLAEAILSLRQ